MLKEAYATPNDLIIFSSEGFELTPGIFKYTVMNKVPFYDNPIILTVFSAYIRWILDHSEVSAYLFSQLNSTVNPSFVICVKQFIF